MLGTQGMAQSSRACVAIVFTAMLGLLRTFAQEREHGIWDGLLGAPIDRALIWLARACSTLVFLVAVQVVALPAFWLFFLQDGPVPSEGRRPARVRAVTTES